MCIELSVSSYRRSDETKDFADTIADWPSALLPWPETTGTPRFRHSHFYVNTCIVNSKALRCGGSPQSPVFVFPKRKLGIKLLIIAFSRWTDWTSDRILGRSNQKLLILSVCLLCAVSNVQLRIPRTFINRRACRCIIYYVQHRYCVIG